MIKWCSYCFRFIRECEPYDQFLISHGVCQACLAKGVTKGDIDKKNLHEFKTFFSSLQATARYGGSAQVSRILAESRRLGIPPMDLLLGLFQPLLVEIGELWATGQVTVSTEHRFSALVGDLLAQLRSEAPRNPEPVSPRLILINASDNYHTLGLQMADTFFTTCGLATLSITPGLPSKEILELIAFHQPEAVGFSLALHTQMKPVGEVAACIRKLPAPPRYLLLGGAAVRMGLPVPTPDFQVCQHLTEVLPLLGA